MWLRSGQGVHQCPRCGQVPIEIDDALVAGVGRLARRASLASRFWLAVANMDRVTRSGSGPGSRRNATGRTESPRYAVARHCEGPIAPVVARIGHTASTPALWKASPRFRATGGPAVRGRVGCRGIDLEDPNDKGPPPWHPRSPSRNLPRRKPRQGTRRSLVAPSTSRHSFANNQHQ